MSRKIDQFTAGVYQRQYQYQSFLPNVINLQWEISDPAALALMDDCNRLLGELNAFSQLIAI